MAYPRIIEEEEEEEKAEINTPKNDINQRKRLLKGCNICLENYINVILWVIQKQVRDIEKTCAGNTNSRYIMKL